MNYSLKVLFSNSSKVPFLNFYLGLIIAVIFGGVAVALYFGIPMLKELSQQDMDRIIE
jgi:hypothetical protein